jgi:two-component system nitrate/nitrite response regulator NarL
MNMRPRHEWLTCRERAVLRHMVEGLCAEQIAEHDFVAVTTVRSQIRSILSKLGVNSQLAAVAYANRLLWQDENLRLEALQRL